MIHFLGLKFAIVSLIGHLYLLIHQNRLNIYIYLSKHLEG